MWLCTHLAIVVAGDKNIQILIFNQQYHIKPLRQLIKNYMHLQFTDNRNIAIST